MSIDKILEDEIEKLIDAYGLYDVTEAIEAVCLGKAEHLAVNWQDMSAAKRWDKAAKQFDRAHTKLHEIQLP